MEEEDLDAVAEAWGGEDEELVPGAPTEGLDEDMEGFEDAAANGDEGEEGGWDMEVRSFKSVIGRKDDTHVACMSMFVTTKSTGMLKHEHGSS